ncbi:MAG TPA: RNA polymerase sigma factor [Phycisphaerae bacterium]|nr:RNA polymerase sigma factor [Phycisphaerae bacterium]
MNLELATLVQQARAGDHAAFERLLRRTARLVYAHIAASVRDRHRAEDLTQETFVRAWKAIGTLEDASGLNAWLLAIARNVVIDAGKSRNRAKRGGATTARVGVREQALEVADEATSGPREMAERAEDRDRILALLEELPEDYRRVLRMRYLGGAGYEDIRQALNLSDGALRGLLARGMAMIRERMGVRRD